MVDFRNLTRQEKNKISSKIAFNISKEAEANEFYFELLNMLSEEDKKYINEIIEDENNHLIILEKLQQKYSGLEPSEFEPFTFLKRKED